MKINDQQLWLLERALYWQMPLFLLLFLLAAIPLARKTKTAWFLPQGAMLGAAITALVFTLVPPKPRMQDDEATLASVADGMYLTGANVMLAQAIPSDHGLVVTKFGIDKRPPLFPFLVSALSGILGPSASRAYHVNACLLTLLMALIFLWARSEYGLESAVAAVFAVPASGCVVWCATSGGFDLAAALLLLTLGFLSSRFVNNPGNARLAPLLAAGLLYCSARYESAPLFGCLLISTLFLSRKSWKPGAAGIAMLVTLLVALIPSGLFGAWLVQRSAYYSREFGGFPAFSPAYFPGNLLALFKNILIPGGAFAAPLLVVGLGAAALRRAASVPRYLAPFLFTLLAATLLFLFYSYGDSSNFSYARFYLPLAIAGAVGAVLSLRPRWALVLSVGSFIQLMVSAQHGLPQSQGADLTDAIDRVLPAFTPRTLVVAETWCPYLITRGYGCVEPAAFEKGQASLLALRAKGQIARVLFLETPPLQGLRGQALVYPGEISVEEAFRGLSVEKIGDGPAELWRLR